MKPDHRPTRRSPAAAWLLAAATVVVWGFALGGPAVSAQEAERLPIPMRRIDEPDDVTLRGHADDDSVTLVATDADLVGVLRMIADHHRLNLVVAPEVSGTVTVQIREAAMSEVLDAITGVAGFHWHRRGNLLVITGEADGLDPSMRGQIIRVYPLNYIAASDVEAVVAGLLSAGGQVFIAESDAADRRRTTERLVVRDNAAVHQAVAMTVASMDVMPPQVLVEAHVLQIALDNENRNGVNLAGLARIGNQRVSVTGRGFATPGDSGPSLALQLDGGDMSGLLESIRQRTNSRTLASPKVSVVNRQEARIQIGQRLPYTVATVTETAAVESVQYLEVGIVLTVTPTITADGHVLMTVSPKISGGTLTETGFYEEDTTEVSTTILMPDGGGVVLGGLIRDATVRSRSDPPIFGRIPIVRDLVRRTTNDCAREELVVALVTHVVPPGTCAVRPHEAMELDQTLRPHAMADTGDVFMGPGAW